MKSQFSVLLGTQAAYYMNGSFKQMLYNILETGFN